MNSESGSVRVAPISRAFTFTAAQWRELVRMREHFRQWGDCLSRHELARLSFMRWLYQNGRLEP